MAARKPDLVGLQKIRVTDGEFPTREFESAGYHATAYCHKGEYGVGILSRRKPTVVRKGLPGQDDLGARNPNALNFTDEERSELSALLDAGFVDLYAHRHPDGRDRFTYWNYRWNRDTLRYGVRLDLILGTRRVVDRVRDVRVDMDYRKSIDGLLPSECAPVIADLDD